MNKQSQHWVRIQKQYDRQSIRLISHERNHQLPHDHFFSDDVENPNDKVSKWVHSDESRGTLSIFLHERLTQHSNEKWFLQYTHHIVLTWKHFEFKNFNIDFMDQNRRGASLVLSAIWSWYKTTVVMLGQLKNKKEITNDLYVDFKPLNPFLPDHDYRWPIIQVLDLMMRQAREVLMGEMSEPPISKLTLQMHSDVQNFWKDIEASLHFHIENGFGAFRSKKFSPIGFGQQTKARFDIKEIRRRLFELENLIPQETKIVDSSSSTFADIKTPDLFQRMAISDRQKNPMKLIVHQEIESQPKSYIKEILLSYFHQLASPFLQLVQDGNSLQLKWKCVQNHTVSILQRKFIAQRKLEKAEESRLKKGLENLAKCDSDFEVKRMRKKVKSFIIDENRYKWKKAIEDQFQLIVNEYNYRFNRMVEFGIIDDYNEMTDKSELYLNEMMLIEEEVSSYVPFVREAFKASLPIRESFQFEAYRHSIDGVEFDISTIQDYQKWMRGEVMRPMKHFKESTEIIQVNAFLLDFSGSMGREKMRNLYKLIYLIILGLEDRKSYDAIHFFGDTFEEGYSFSHTYTNRKLLFRILKVVCRIRHGKLWFGGRGGTNLSDGLSKSFDELQIFIKQLRTQHPGKNFVSSLFVVTDGEPSLGILKPKKLNGFIQELREKDDTIIKGVYIRPEESPDTFIKEIFGAKHFIESTSFEKIVQDFVHFITMNYKEQRKQFKQKEKHFKSEKNA